MTKLLPYKAVREMFGWKSNTPIRAAIKAGLLERVSTGGGLNSWKITEDSALALQASRRHHNSTDEATYLRKAAARTEKMRSARRLPLPVPGEDGFPDPVEITRNARMGQAERSPEVWDHYHNKPVAIAKTPGLPPPCATSASSRPD